MEEEIKISDIFKMIIKNWYILLLFIILGIALGICYTSFIMKEEYSSKSGILVMISKEGEPVEYDYNNSMMIINTVSELAKQSVILNSVAEKNNIEMKKLINMISITRSPSSLLLIITVVAEKKEIAQTIANDVADFLILECSHNSSLAMIGNSLLKTSEAGEATYTGRNKILIVMLFVAVFLILGGIGALSKEFILEKIHDKEKNKIKVANPLKNV